MKQLINVTEEDIQTTEQHNSQACMVWRAVTRNLQLETQTGASPVIVSVSYDRIVLQGKRGEISVPLSTYVNSRIRKFDNDRSLVKPFNFNLDLPDDWREQVAGMGGAK